MCERNQYKIQTLKQAKSEGYTQVAKLHLSKPEDFFEIIDKMKKKLAWLRALSQSRNIPEKELHQYRLLLHYSFVIVDQKGHPEYIRQSSGYRYCFWCRFNIYSN